MKTKCQSRCVESFIVKLELFFSFFFRFNNMRTYNLHGPHMHTRSSSNVAISSIYIQMTENHTTFTITCVSPFNWSDWCTYTLVDGDDAHSRTRTHACLQSIHIRCWIFIFKWFIDPKTELFSDRTIRMFCSFQDQRKWCDRFIWKLTERCSVGQLLWLPKIVFYRRRRTRIHERSK